MWEEKCTRSVCQTVQYSYSLGIVITIMASTRRQCVRFHLAALSKYSTTKSLLSCSLSQSTTVLRRSTNSLKCVRFGEYLFCVSSYLLSISFGDAQSRRIPIVKARKLIENIWKAFPILLNLSITVSPSDIILYVMNFFIVIVDPTLFPMVLLVEIGSW